MLAYSQPPGPTPRLPGSETWCTKDEDVLTIPKQSLAGRQGKSHNLTITGWILKLKCQRTRTFTPCTEFLSGVFQQDSCACVYYGILIFRPYLTTSCSGTRSRKGLEPSSFHHELLFYWQVRALSCLCPCIRHPTTGIISSGQKNSAFCLDHILFIIIFKISEILLRIFPTE